MNEWLKANSYQLIAMVIGTALVVGQWNTRQDVARVDIDRHAIRLLRLEDLAATERARLDSVYLRRELSEEQLRSIAVALDGISKRLEQIEGRITR